MFSRKRESNNYKKKKEGEFRILRSGYGITMHPLLLCGMNDLNLIYILKLLLQYLSLIEEQNQEKTYLDSSETTVGLSRVMLSP